MDETLKRLNLPDADDEEAIEKMNQRADLSRVEAVSKAVNQMERIESKGGKYPGSHLVDYANKMIRAESKGRMQWKLAFQEAMYGGGMKTRFTEDDEPADIYYIDEVTEMFGNPVFMGIDVPDDPQSVVVVVIDTSGSVDDGDFKIAVEEIMSLKRSANAFSDSASEVLVVCGDTTMREGVQQINEDNYEAIMRDGVKRAGYGGTNLALVLRQALELDEIKEKQVRGVIMLTDSYDTPPKYDQLGLDEHPGTAIIYGIFPSTGSGDAERFAEAVSDYARVVMIEEGAEVHMTEDFKERMTVSPSQRRRASP